MFDPSQITINFRESFSDWHRASRETLLQKENQLLKKYISFYESDSDQRSAKVLDVPINEAGSQFIHELFIENDKDLDCSDPESIHIVFIHGFGASLGFFFKNYEPFLHVKNVKLHFLDLLGFGLSSRPDFPKFNPKFTKYQDLKDVESFFVEAIDKWRQQRIPNNQKFYLIAHSLGGYLSFEYSLQFGKYLKKLVLISPVGVETSPYSELYSIANNTGEISPTYYKSKELLIKIRAAQKNDAKNGIFTRTIFYFWENHVFTPLSFVRFAGPFGSKLTLGWSRRRFSSKSVTTQEEFMAFHRYVYYSIVGLPKSGECCITRLLAPGVVAFFPILEKIPTKKIDIQAIQYYKNVYGLDEDLKKERSTIINDIPNLWLYGANDWMNKEAGKEAVSKINMIHQEFFTNVENASPSSIAEFELVPDAGHHVYLDNPTVFLDSVLKFFELN